MLGVYARAWHGRQKGACGSLGVQRGPLARNGHLVPDIPHILNQRQVLHLIARSNLQADVTCAAREPPYTSPFYLLQALPQIFGRPGSKASQVYQQSLLQSAFHLSRELLICVCISASASLDFNHCPDVALQEVRETMLRLQRSALCKCLTVSYPCAGTKG